MTSPLASHHNSHTSFPVANGPKIKPMCNLNGCCTITTWSYNYRGVPIVLYAFKSKGQCKWVVFPWQDYYIQASHRNGSTTPTTHRGKISKYLTDGQLECLPRNNHKIIQLQRCFYCFICFQMSMKLGGLSTAGLLYKNHTRMAPQLIMWPNRQKTNQCATWMAVAQ